MAKPPMLEFDPKLYAELEVLMTEGGMTPKEFSNVAFTFLKWAIRQIKNDHMIAAIDEPANKYYELQMVELERYRPVKPIT